MNPYKPPAPESLIPAGEIQDANIIIAATLVFSPDHLKESLRRYRFQHRGRQVWKWIRWLISTFTLLVAILSLFGETFVFSVILIGLALFLLFSDKIDNYLAVRNLRRSPHYNKRQTMEFSNEGLRSV